MTSFVRSALVASIVVSFALVGVAPSGVAEHCDPREPDCKHEEGDAKAHCYWTRTGAPGTTATGGADVANQVVTLHCPNHIFAKSDFGYKDCRGLVGDCESLAGDYVVTDLGELPQPGTPCGWTHSWHVYAPNINIYAFYLKAATWKDADCDGAADDWNAHAVTDDGREACYWINYYGPKPWENPQGLHYPYHAPPYAPTPDGLVDACDRQVYETQWRQFN